MSAASQRLRSRNRLRITEKASSGTQSFQFGNRISQLDDWCVFASQGRMSSDCAEAQSNPSKRICRVSRSREQTQDVELRCEREDCPKGPKVPGHRENEHIVFMRHHKIVFCSRVYGVPLSPGKRANRTSASTRLPEWHVLVSNDSDPSHSEARANV